MRKLFLFIMVSFSLMAYAQTKNTTTRTMSSVAKQDSFQIKIDSLLSHIETLMQENNVYLEHLEINTSLKGRYKLYPTENNFNFLLLDTKTGRIDQVQWSLKKEEEGSISINSEDLSLMGGFGSGTFELYPTKNMFQFILVDKTNGRTWHVQWGLKASERWIREIF